MLIVVLWVLLFGLCFCLSDADLSGADLNGTDLSNANLEGAKVTSEHLPRPNPSEARPCPMARYTSDAGNPGGFWQARVWLWQLTCDTLGPTRLEEGAK